MPAADFSTSCGLSSPTTLLTALSAAARGATSFAMLLRENAKGKQ
jgi:hypothetical protein